MFRLLGEELPYSCAVLIDRFAEEGALRRIHATIIVDKESHKGIVVGAGGSRLKKIATQARLDMEQLFGGKVHLEVWVKAKPGWSEDRRFLQRLGHG
jgi:GTP-binding protein Era